MSSEDVLSMQDAAPVEIIGQKRKRTQDTMDCKEVLCALLEILRNTSKPVSNELLARDIPETEHCWIPSEERMRELKCDEPEEKIEISWEQRCAIALAEHEKEWEKECLAALKEFEDEELYE